MNSISFTAFYTQELRETIGQLSHKALRVYVLIATYADKRGVCWPGIKELADIGNMRVESVIDGLRELEELALICYARRNEKDPVTGKSLVNVYVVSGCLLRETDSAFDSSSKHEPIPPLVLKSDTTNNIVTNSIGTNDNKPIPFNQLQEPPPPTTKRALKKKATTRTDDYETPQQPQTANHNDSSAAGTAAQNSKPALPPLPPLPRDFDADTPLMDPDAEQVARWLCDQAKTVTADGAQYRAALSMANARRYIVRFDRWRIRAAISLSRRDPATKSLIGRMDYLLRTSVAEEAQQLKDEMQRMNDLDQVGD